MCIFVFLIYSPSSKSAYIQNILNKTGKRLSFKVSFSIIFSKYVYLLWYLGGVHAAMVGSLHPTPIAIFPFLSPHSAVVAFCEGILKYGTAWEALRKDLAMQDNAMTLEEVRERMRNVLSLTDVTRFPIPKNPSSVIFVAATVSSQSFCVCICLLW